ncbi:MAG: hypothetical protein A2Z20_10635 [Bdellovibrionales bacterium RBG_16_40_8]|nr:MAG: hypothetical protein A2Z20_10635 [Bdellovibrionales bacterium RBG_16_40_8]
MKLYQNIFLLFYRIIFMPLAIIFIFIFILPFSKKIQKSLLLRKNEKLPEPLQQKPIWIHASSGEFEYAKPVISAIKKWQPDIPIVVTYFSPSYAEQIKKFSGVDFSLPLPLDLPNPINQFIRKINPQMLLVARTDLWPEMLLAVKKNKIPSLLFSTTFRSIAKFRCIKKIYYNLLFNQFTNIFAVSELDSHNIKETNTNTLVTVYGDTRYDQVILRLKNSHTLNENILQNVRCPIFVAGSTWPEDEEVILPALDSLLKSEKIKLILAPHEPSIAHLKKIEKVLRKLDISFEYYSKATVLKSNVLIIDKTGILAELYTKAQIAFVGGSFKNKVHSVMEPLAAGLLTFVGPKHTNNREAIIFQKILTPMKLAAVTCVQNAKDLRYNVEQILSQEDLTKSHFFIKSEISKCSGGTAHVLAWAKKYYNISRKNSLTGGEYW